MIFKNVSWLMAAQFIRLALGLIVGTWLTRALGPEQNGVLGTALVIGVLAGFLADFGLRQVLIKELAIRPEDAPVIFGSAARMLFSFGAASYLLACAAAWIWGGADMLRLGLILYSPLFTNGYLAVLSRWDANRQAYRTARFGLIGNAVSNAAKVACILTGANLTFAAAAVALEILTASVTVFGWTLRSGWWSQFWLWDAATARKLLKEAIPLFLSHSGTLLLLRLDQLMVFRIAGEAEAGIYAAATRLSEVVYSAGPIVIMTFLPVLSQAFARDRETYLRQRACLFGVMSAIGLLSALGWWVIGPRVVDWVYGSAFRGASAILLVHCLAALPYLHGELRGSVLVVEQQSGTSARVALCGVLINLALNLWLIPRHGALGAAWATAATYFMVWFAASLIVPAFRPMGMQQLQSLAAPWVIWRHWRSLKELTRTASA